MKKQNGDTLLYIFFALLLVVIVMLGLYYAKISKTEKKTITETPSVVPTVHIPTRKPEDLPIVKKDAVTNQEIIEIPFLYAIRSITDEEMVFGKDGGTAEEVISFFPKKQTIKVFKGLPPSEVAANLSDLKVGQKIKVKSIVGEAMYFYITQ